MSEQTLQAPPIREPVIPERTAEQRRAPSPIEFVKRHPWVFGAIGLLAISTAIVAWANVRPGYDPYGWLVWGHLTLHGKLDTNGAPSWKPLPFLFTVPFAIFGHYALWLWMITAVAISLAGVVFAWRIAFTLTNASPERRYAAYAAGLVAGLAVLGIRDYTHYWLSAQSDSMIVTLCLAAIDCHLSGRKRWAFWCWGLAGLGRPEAWPFLALYSIYLWRTMPSYRRWIVAGLVVQPALWFGIPAFTAKSWFVAGNNALHSPRELTHNKFFGTLHRFTKEQELPVQLAALLAIVLAFYRRERMTLLLAAGAAVWILIECAYALHGWPAVSRYMFEPTAVLGVLAGIAIGRVILDVPPYLSKVAPRLSPQRIGPRFATRIGNWGAIIVLAVFAGSMLPPARSRLRIERADLKHERLRAKEMNRLSTVVKILGAAHIKACGQPDIPVGWQSALAWYMGDVNVGQLYYSPLFEREHPHTVVNMYPLSQGWNVFPSHVTAATASACRGLVLKYGS